MNNIIKIWIVALDPNVDRSLTLSPREYPGQASFTTVQKMIVRRRKKDLSACVAPDNVWVRDDTVRKRKNNMSACLLFRNTGNNVRVREDGLPGVTAIHPNAVRSQTLTPREYPGQAGFTTVQTNNIWRKKQDLSAPIAIGVAPDNVWVQDDNNVWMQGKRLVKVE